MLLLEAAILQGKHLIGGTVFVLPLWYWQLSCLYDTFVWGAKAWVLMLRASISCTRRVMNPGCRYVLAGTHTTPWFPLSHKAWNVTQWEMHSFRVKDKHTNIFLGILGKGSTLQVIKIEVLTILLFSHRAIAKKGPKGVCYSWRMLTWQRGS